MSAFRLVLAAASAALAGLSFTPVFGGLGAGLLLALLVPPAAVLGWALWAGYGDRRPRVPAVVAGLLVVTVAVGATTLPGADVLSGPYRLLTGALPADPDGPQLATASALTGFAALVCCHLVLTGRPALATMLPSLVCLLAGLGLGATIAPLPAWYPAAFVGLAGLQLFLARPATERAGAGRLVTAALALVVGVGTPVALGGVLPGADGREPADLRALVDSPVRPKNDTNPFAQYLALRNGQLVLTMSGTASEQVPRLRMVTLTEFDGLTWSTRADYNRAGLRLPPAENTTRTRRNTLDVTVDTPESLGWLPAAGRPTELSVAGLGVDETTGNVVVPAGTETPARYRVTGAEPVITGAELARSEPAPGTTGPDLDLPPDVLDFIAKATAPALTDSERLLALYDTLKAAPFGYDGTADAPGGHSLFRINELVRDKRGTSEQYASAFAVMCRQLGFDARVALGFRPQWKDTTFEVTGRDVHAWTEVRFGRLGWVAIDPTPEHASPGREPEGEQPPPPPAADPLDEVPAPGQQPPPESSGDAAADATVPPGSTTNVLAWTAVAAGVVLVLLLAIPAGKATRRARRRRNGSARERGLAAWHEALDALRESGVRLPRFATTNEIVAAGGESCPPAMRSLAWRTDVTAFAPEEATDGDVRAAWVDSDDVRTALRRGMTLPARVRATFDPRPLWTSR